MKTLFRFFGKLLRTILIIIGILAVVIVFALFRSETGKKSAHVSTPAPAAARPSTPRPVSTPRPTSTPVITAEPQEEEEEAEEIVEEVMEEESTPARTGLDPEFKEAMDAYEDFIDEYVSFMTKYKDSDNPTALMMDYLQYMSRLQEYAEKMEALEDDDELSDEELNYYFEVMLRCEQKLLKAM